MLQYQVDLVNSMGMEMIALDEKFVYKTGEAKPARIANMCFRNKHFRFVRLSYFDAGESVQVFNSLWYPSYEYDLPLFGVDLISLGPSRVLNVIDFQPLHPTEEYSQKYIDYLGSIREKYPDLQGTLSGKIYDDTSFFSKNMLFGRFKDSSKVNSVVLPAYKEYLHEYVELMNKAQPNFDEKAMNEVKERQTAYDCYSALKDPAVGLFDAYFGKKWSHDFVHDFLFKLSTQPSTSESSTSSLPVGSPVHTFAINADGRVSPSSSKVHH